MSLVSGRVNQPPFQTWYEIGGSLPFGKWTCYPWTSKCNTCWSDMWTPKTYPPKKTNFSRGFSPGEDGNGGTSWSWGDSFFYGISEKKTSERQTIIFRFDSLSFGGCIHLDVGWLGTNAKIWWKHHHTVTATMVQGLWSRKRILLGQASWCWWWSHRCIPHRGKSRFRFGVLHPKSVRVLVVAVRGGCEPYVF